MKQTTLTDKAPMILDATCSFYRNWPKHATIRMDKRSEVKPDVVGDIRKTNFPDSYFDAVYLDPPHMIRKDPMILGHDITQIRRLRRLGTYGIKTPGFYHELSRYGHFKSKDEWYDFLDKVNVELLRILKPNGKCYWKLMFGKDTRLIKQEDLQRLTNFKTIEKKVTKSKVRSTNEVHWLTMVPITLERNCNEN